MALTLLLILVFFGFSSPTSGAIALVARNVSLSQPRSELAAASVGNLALFAGGVVSVRNAGGMPSNRVDIYNATSNSWTNATLSIARRLLAATSVKNLALFAGGDPMNSDFRPSRRVDIYDATSNSWTVGNLSVARYSLAATTVGNLAIFAGGYATALRSDVVDIYNWASNSWTTASLSVPRQSIAATSAQDIAIFAGGLTLRGGSKAVDIYNSTSNTWTNATLSIDSSVSATSVGLLVIFFSYDGVEFYNIANNSWIVSNPPRFRRFNSAAATVGNFAFFAGGESGVETFSDEVDIYNAVNDTWTTSTLSDARSAPAVATIGQMVIFAGGYKGYQKVDSIAVDMFQFQEVNTTSRNASSPSQATSSGQVTASSGQTSSGQTSPSVQISSVSAQQTSPSAQSASSSKLTGSTSRIGESSDSTGVSIIVSASLSVLVILC